MERQSHEESMMLWKIELESAKHINLTEEHAKLLEVVSNKIEDYSLTYYEYVDDIVEYLDKTSNTNDPKETVKNMCNHLIEKYNG